jgi:predicted nuclease of predicted toxin-antitoxin system
MKLLLDENLSRRVVPFIQDAFPDSTQIALLGMENSADKDIWQYAKDHDYVIVTKDSDFYEMSLLYGSPPKILWLKIGNQTKAATIRALTENSVDIERVLMAENKACVEVY